MPRIRRPEARMSTYSKLLLRPIEVQFAKNWDPENERLGAL